jgi:hypothetical protein
MEIHQIQASHLELEVDQMMVDLQHSEKTMSTPIIKAENQ